MFLITQFRINVQVILVYTNTIGIVRKKIYVKNSLAIMLHNDRVLA